DATTIESLTERFLRVLTAIAADPEVRVGDIELLDEAERTRVLARPPPCTRPVVSITRGPRAAGAATLDAVIAGDGACGRDRDGCARDELCAGRRWCEHRAVIGWSEYGTQGRGDVWPTRGLRRQKLVGRERYRSSMAYARSHLEY
ncbi:hypothetical protein, partial [Nocardia cyriacigeorgica]|uniref:hypothetical protein n=1 Tax=Nocardia cyriacigeorgica TaxID=135487 RepID=UPI002454771E